VSLPGQKFRNRLVITIYAVGPVQWAVYIFQCEVTIVWPGYLGCTHGIHSLNKTLEFVAVAICKCQALFGLWAKYGDVVGK